MSSNTRIVHLAPVLYPSLEESFADCLTGLRRKNPFTKIKVLLGSHLLLLWMRDRLACSCGYYMVDFLTIEALVKEYSDMALSENSASRLPRGSSHLLLERFFTNYSSDNNPFSHITEKENFLSGMLSTFTELKEAARHPEEVLFEEGRERVVLDFVNYYNAELACNSFVDSTDCYWLACDKLKEKQPHLPTEILLCYGMYDFNFAQSEVLKAFFNGFLEVHFFLPYTRNRTHILPRKTLLWLNREGFIEKQYTKEPKHILTPLLLESENKSTKSANGFLEAERARDLFPQNTVSGTTCMSQVKLFTAQTELCEVEEIARKILCICKKDHVLFRDIAVVLRNPSLYKNIVVSVFSRVGIPVNCAEGLDFSETITFNSISLFLRLMSGSYRREEVMAFLVHAKLNYSELLGVSAPPIHLWENFAVMAKIVEGKREWKEKLRGLYKRYSSSEDIDENTVAELKKFIDFVDMVFTDLKKLDAMSGVKRIVGFIKSILYRYFPKSEEMRILFSILDELLGLEAFSGEVTARSLIYIFLNEAKAKTFTPIEESQDHGVLISDLMKPRGIGYHTVFIPGTAEKMFPKLRSEDPILPDNVRRLLIRRGLKIGLKKIEDGEESLLFLNAVYSAEKYLFISYPKRNMGSSKENSPSLFFIRAREFLDEQGMVEPSFEGEALSIQEKELDSIWTHGKGKLDREYLSLLLPGHELLKRSVQRNAKTWRNELFSTYEGCLEASALGGLFAGIGKQHITLSPTKLETYARCPYSFFLNYLLELGEYEKPSRFNVIRPQDRGNIYHSVLYRLFTKLVEDKSLPIDESNIRDVLSLLNEVSKGSFWQFEMGGLSCFRLLWEMEKEIISADLTEVIKLTKHAQSMPLSLEYRFGRTKHKEEESSNSTDEYYEYEVDGIKYRFSGKVDRLDIYPDGTYKIVDYKTGKPMLKKNVFSGGENLQLPIYMLAAAEFFGLGEGISAEYFYITKKHKFSSREFSLDDFKKHSGEFHKILKTFAVSMRAGLFFPYPEEGKCKVCSFCDICSKDNELLFNKKKMTDKRVFPFLEVKEIE